MPTIDFEYIKKLPPDQRVKVLQQLHDQLEKLIRERKQEITSAQELLEKAQEELIVLQKIETPQPKKTIVEELFKTEEKENGLERITRQQKIPRPEDIREHFEQKPIAELYKRINDITGEIRETGIVTAYQENFLRAANYEIHDREKAVRNQLYQPTEKALHQMTAAERIIKNYID